MSAGNTVKTHSGGLILSCCCVNSVITGCGDYSKHSSHSHSSEIHHYNPIVEQTDGG
jgi:hypothetical protein